MPVIPASLVTTQMLDSLISGNHSEDALVVLDFLQEVGLGHRFLDSEGNTKSITHPIEFAKNTSVHHWLLVFGLQYMTGFSVQTTRSLAVCDEVAGYILGIREGGWTEFPVIPVSDWYMPQDIAAASLQAICKDTMFVRQYAEVLASMYAQRSDWDLEICISARQRVYALTHLAPVLPAVPANLIPIVRNSFL